MKEKFKANSAVILLFLIISFCVMIPFYKHNVLNSGSDMQFHLNRINEIYQCLRNGGTYPFVSVYSFNHVGMPVNMMYPSVFLYFFAFLRFLIHNPVTATYAGINLLIFLSCVINYKIGLKFWKNDKRKSFIFAILYTLSTNYFLLLFSGFTLGEAIAAVFLPAVFYGMYSIFFSEKNEWYILALGMICVLYAHLLSVLIYTMSLFIIFLIALKYSHNILKGIVSLVLAVVSVMLGGTFFFVGFFKAIMSTHMHMTAVFDLQNTAIGLGDFAKNSLDNNAIGAIFFIILIISIVKWSSFRPEIRVIIVLAMAFCILTTNLIPWRLFQNTPLNVIQFPYRFLTVANLFLAIISVELFSFFDLEVGIKKWIMPIVVTALCGISFVSSTFVFFSNTQSEPEVSRIPTVKKSINMTNFKVTPAQFNNILKFNNGVGSTDYWPQKSVPFFNSIVTHRLILNGHYRIKVNPKLYPNSIMYEVNLKNGVQSIDLPVLNYSFYNVSVDGKDKKFSMSKRGTIQINNLKKGKSKINITYNVSAVQKIAVVVSVVSITLLFVLCEYQRIKSIKNDKKAKD
ncbi:MAG: hypothetical protein DUD32_00105 [Lactobacillus sp.]|nr:MAG: hypothetical protein DUD32_00105 [Lactobacillus sp.]